MVGRIRLRWLFIYFFFLVSGLQENVLSIREEEVPKPIEGET